jgi:hypothetical protein
VNGNIENNTAASASFSNINLAGSSSQTIGGLNSLSFNNLQINGGGQKNLNKDITITGVMTFSNGYVVPAASQKVIFTSTSSVTGAKDASFVKGPVQKIGFANGGFFEYPIGAANTSNVNYYQPVILTFASGQGNSNTTFTCTPTTQRPSDVAVKSYKVGIRDVQPQLIPAYLVDIHDDVWGTSDGQPYSSGVKVQMIINDNFNSLYQQPILYIAHQTTDPSPSWELPNLAQNSKVLLNGIVTLTVLGQKNFSLFGGASTTEALPVNISAFIANLENSRLKLIWSTTSEQNNKGFEIQRSIGNTNDFKSIGFVGTRAKDGNSQTEISYSFEDADVKAGQTHYYRLNQIDFDGKSTFSPVRSVKPGSIESNLNVYPNPSQGSVTVNTGSASGKLNIYVLDNSGRVVNQYINVSTSNTRISNLKKGFYTLKIVNTESGEQSAQRVVVQ